MSSIRATARASAAVALSQYVARAVVVVRGLIAASVLGPAGYGGWNALNLILDYGFFAPAGALQGLDLRLPAAAARNDAVAARRLMAGAWAATLAGAVAFSAVVLLVPPAARAVGSPFGIGAVVLMLVATALQLALLYLFSALRAHGRFGAVSGGQSLQALAGGGLGLALLWRWGVWGLLAGWIVGTLAAVSWMARAIPEAPRIPGELREGGALVVAGLPVFAFYALSLLLRSSDRMAFVHFGQAKALGHYSLGLMAAGLVLYVPEALGFVLFPQVAAAAAGARDAAGARADLVRAHRVLGVLLPLPVALAMVWSGPVILALLPDYAEGIASLRLLALGAMAFSVSTLPGYFLLASGDRRRLIGIGAAAVLLNGLLVFGVAARDPRPASVATAALAGYVVFALGLVVAASFELFPGTRERMRFTLRSFAPAAWTGVVAVAAQALLPAETVGAALGKSAIVIALALPALFLWARGTGLFTRPGAAEGGGRP